MLLLACMPNNIAPPVTNLYYTTYPSLVEMIRLWHSYKRKTQVNLNCTIVLRRFRFEHSLITFRRL